MRRKRIVLAAASVFVALLLGEAAVRVFTDVTQGLEIRDPELGRRHVRGWRGEVYSTETKRRIPLRFNRDGFRGPDRPFAKPAGVTRIAILGDSMIAGLEVEEEHTLVRRLEELLHASHPERRFEVFNFGVGGASPGQALVLYRQLASRYDPDIVVSAFFVGNDLSDNCARFTGAPRLYFDLDPAGRLVQQPFSGARAAGSAWLNRNSRLYVWKKRACSLLRRRIAAAAGASRHNAQVFRTEPAGDVAHAWKITEALVRAWARDVAGRGADFVQLVVPVAEQVHDDAFETLIREFGGRREEYEAGYPDRRLGRVCGAAGIRFLSLREDFRRAARTGGGCLFNGGVAHFSERGHDLAARRLHRYLTIGLLAR